MFRKPYGYRRAYYGGRPRSNVGCGLGGCGTSILFSVIATILTNLLLRNRY